MTNPENRQEQESGKAPMSWNLSHRSWRGIGLSATDGKLSLKHATVWPFQVTNGRRAIGVSVWDFAVNLPNTPFVWGCQMGSGGNVVSRR